VVLFVTGLILRWGNFLPVSVRTGATFVHDVFAVTFTVVIVGHIGFALTTRRRCAAWSRAGSPLSGPPPRAGWDVPTSSPATTPRSGDKTAA